MAKRGDAWVTNTAQANRCKKIVRSRREPCHICKKPIDYSLRYPNPMSFSVEHIKPRHLYPDLIFDVTNMAAAHLECNVRNQGKNPWVPITEAVNSRDW